MKMDRPEKKIKTLPNDRERALAQLCNTPQARNKVDEEKKYFLLYLNLLLVLTHHRNIDFHQQLHNNRHHLPL